MKRSFYLTLTPEARNASILLTTAPGHYLAVEGSEFAHCQALLPYAVLFQPHSVFSCEASATCKASTYSREGRQTGQQLLIGFQLMYQ